MLRFAFALSILYKFNMQKHDLLDIDSKLKFPQIWLVRASAGSGKTHTLTLRIAQFLMSEKIPNNDLNNLLAVTFTNNAANEMRDRVFKWLKSIALGIKDKDIEDIYSVISMDSRKIEERARNLLSHILKHYSDFNIGTIDSFANRIIQSCAYDMGLSPQLEIVESFDDIADYAFFDMLSRVTKDTNISNILMEFAGKNQYMKFSLNPVSEIKKKIKEWFKNLNSSNKEIYWEDQREKIETCINKLKDLYSKKDQYGKKYKTNSKIVQLMESENIDIKELVSANITPKNETREYDEQWKAIIDELAYAYSLQKNYHYSKIYNAFKKYFKDASTRNNTIHIGEINKRLGDYINDENIPDIFFRLGNKLFHFLIDEFQDIGYVQWHNLIPLITEALSKGGSLFAVGDLKQAIYRFRGADYEIMRSLEQQMANNTPPLASISVDNRIKSLAWNYRSGGNIVSYVENIFKNKQKLNAILDGLGDVAGFLTYKQKAIDKNRSHGYVQTIILEYKNKDALSPLIREEIEKILEGLKERYSYSDIAILARQKKEAQEIMGWLIEKGIPAISYDNPDIRERKVISELKYLLKFLETPVDDLSFATFIMGNIFYESAHPENIEAFLFQAAPQKRPLYILFKETYPRLWETFFEELFNEVGYLPVYELVSRIYSIFHLFSKFTTEHTAFVHLLDVVSELERAGKNSVRHLLLEFEKSGSELFIGDVPVHMNAVKLMTIHKAKGLGFPVVINVFIPKGNDKGYDIIFEDKGKLRYVYITGNISKNSKTLNNIKKHEEAKKNQDKLNVIYVALTRAMDELYNIVACKVNNKSNSKQCPQCLLFENITLGQKENIKKRKNSIRYESIDSTSCSPLHVKSERPWSVSRIIDAKRGDFYHRVMSELYTNTDAKNIEAIINKTSSLMNFTPEENALELIMDLLNNKDIRNWFVMKESRIIYNEKEFTDKNGARYRMDRVVVDRDAATVIDYKTGNPDKFESSEHISQISNYADILRSIYPEKPIKGLLLYLDTKKIVEVV